MKISQKIINACSVGFVVYCLVVWAFIIFMLCSSCGCNDSSCDVVFENPTPPAVLTCTVVDGKVVVTAHSWYNAVIEREDDPGHRAEFVGSFTAVDSPCPGVYTYTLLVGQTGEYLVQTIDTEELVTGVYGCVVKVKICHNGQTIEVDQSAVAAHLAHGDYLGTCKPEVCNNNKDDDADGKVDCEDSDCEDSSHCVIVYPEDCDNGLDDDGDGKVDCADSECVSEEHCVPPVPEVCNDSKDNDKDGFIDCADSDCASSPHCIVPPPPCVDGGWTVNIDPENRRWVAKEF